MTKNRSTGTRDYITEVAGLIEEFTGDGLYSTVDVARRIVKMLEDEDPELLEGWLRIRAEEFVRETIARRDRSIRARLRVTQPRAAFQQAIEAAESGDNSGLVNWLESPWSIQGRIKPLGQMTGSDLRSASGRYRLRARENGIRAAFLTALANRVGDDSVADHFENEELDRIWRSINS